MAQTGYRGVNPQLPHQVWRNALANIINNVLLQGKFNCGLDVTLTENAATTTLTDPRITADSVIVFMPTTSNAAAELGTLYVTGRKKGEATINHANNAQTDRTYRVGIFG